MDKKILEITSSISIPFSEFRFSAARSSGPGGQNVNKVNSKVYLRWATEESQSLPQGVLMRFQQKYRNRITTEGDFVISSQLSRDQFKNKMDCLGRLREFILAVLVPPKKRKKRRVSRAQKEKRLDFKRKRSARKQSRKRPPLSE